MVGFLHVFNKQENGQISHWQKNSMTVGEKKSLKEMRRLFYDHASWEPTAIDQSKECLPLLIWLIGLCKTGEMSDISQVVEYLKAK